MLIAEDDPNASCCLPVDCGQDMQYYECTPSCKNTCENFSNPEAKCQCGPPGCFCRKDMVKRADGKCVFASQCPVKAICRANAKFSLCESPCRPTCENPAPAPCNQPCVAGCFCEPGFVEDVDGRCVHFRNCSNMLRPVSCKPDEQYYECTPTCNNTCEHLNDPGVKCQCGQPGCFCRKGLVKGPDGKCVFPSQCPEPLNYFRLKTGTFHPM
ncbi:uncharacterized protein CEXT_77461 [Caerostris extrusa]|uniref:TIL domain-containing protein n=1 Tax=Caerostris extrusa TaxID=172846 RepID=A0AAV4Y4L9_CAEEX|nr:uncharacterized protein CEXT_77461 [Caerostris extrusa]